MTVVISRGQEDLFVYMTWDSRSFSWRVREALSEEGHKVRLSPEELSEARLRASEGLDQRGV